MAAKKKSSKGGGKGITKSGFIRSLPDRTPAKEVIAKGKDAGLELKEKFVWTVQSEMRSKGNGATPSASSKAVKAASATATSAPKATKPKKGKKKSKATKQPTVTTSVKSSTMRSPFTLSSAEQKMKAIIVELGTVRADQVYRAVKSQLDALVGGA